MIGMGKIWQERNYDITFKSVMYKCIYNYCIDDKDQKTILYIFFLFLFFYLLSTYPFLVLSFFFKFVLILFCKKKTFFNKN